jgi:hypothetical protein
MKRIRAVVFVSDKDIVEFQIIVNESNVMDLLDNFNQFDADLADCLQSEGFVPLI